MVHGCGRFRGDERDVHPVTEVRGRRSESSPGVGAPAAVEEHLLSSAHSVVGLRGCAEPGRRAAPLPRDERGGEATATRRCGTWPGARPLATHRGKGRRSRHPRKGHQQASGSPGPWASSDRAQTDRARSQGDGAAAGQPNGQSQEEARVGAGRPSWGSMWLVHKANRPRWCGRGSRKEPRRPCGQVAGGKGQASAVGLVGGSPQAGPGVGRPRHIPTGTEGDETRPCRSGPGRGSLCVESYRFSGERRWCHACVEWGGRRSRHEGLLPWLPGLRLQGLGLGGFSTPRWRVGPERSCALVRGRRAGSGVLAVQPQNQHQPVSGPVGTSTAPGTMRGLGATMRRGLEGTQLAPGPPARSPCLQIWVLAQVPAWIQVTSKHTCIPGLRVRPEPDQRDGARGRGARQGPAAAHRHLGEGQAAASAAGRAPAGHGRAGAGLQGGVSC